MADQNYSISRHFRPQFVYVIENHDTGQIKIGKSIHPSTRIKHIASQGGFAVGRRYCSVPVVDAGIAERIAHEYLVDVRRIGEWFCCSFDHAVKHVIDAMDECTPYSEADAHLKTLEQRRRGAKFIDAMFGRPMNA